MNWFLAVATFAVIFVGFGVYTVAAAINNVAGELMSLKFSLAHDLIKIELRPEYDRLKLDVKQSATEAR